VIVEGLKHLVCVSCFVLMKLVLRFLFEFNFGVVCYFAGFVPWFVLMKFVQMCLFEFDFGVVCFAGFGSWSAWSYDRGRLILLWLFCLLI